MKKLLGVGLLAWLLCPSVQAVDLPKRKAGLWEISMQMDNAGGPLGRGMTMQQCTDDKTDAQLQERSMNGGGAEQKCDPPVVTRNNGGWVADVVCHQGNGTQKSHAVGSGDFGSNYQVDVIVSFDPPLKPGLDKMHSLMKARYLGACPADMKPGDMYFNGVKMNLNDMMSKSGSARSMTPEQMRKMLDSMKQQ